MEARYHAKDFENEGEFGRNLVEPDNVGEFEHPIIACTLTLHLVARHHVRNEHVRIPAKDEHEIMNFVYKIHG